LKELEKDGDIKKLKSSKFKNRNLFFLADVEPNAEVTDGIFGKEDFDFQTTEVLG
jgi:hypothetical protein